jgi:hypothetical protein
MKSKIFLLIILFFGCLPLFSQIPEDNEDPTNNPGCWPPPCIPVDGGIVFLIAAGAAYGTKKIYDFKKEK